MESKQFNTKESAYVQVKRLYKSVINSADISDAGYTASHTALFVCNGKPINSANIDTNRFTDWVNQLTGIKYTTVERYLRLFKSLDNK